MEVADKEDIKKTHEHFPQHPHTYSPAPNPPPGASTSPSLVLRNGYTLHSLPTFLHLSQLPPHPTCLDRIIPNRPHTSRVIFSLCECFVGEIVPG